MSENKTNVPKIRFPGFTDPWEQRKWEDTVDISTNMVDPETGSYDELPHIGPGNIESFTGKILDNVLRVKDSNLISGKFHFYKGDIIYGKINPQLGKYAIAPFEGLASADSYILNTKNGVVQNFLYSVLQTKDFYKYSVSVSARTGIPKINRDELNVYTYKAPKTEEQTKIGNFFVELDHLITLHQRELTHLQDEKKSLLQKMFPKKGEDVPEIRFPEFTHPWGQRKLGDLVTQIIREVPKPDKPYTRISVRSHAKGTFHQQVDNPDKVAMNKLFVVKEDDLIVNITFAWEHAIAVANKSDDGLLVSHRFPTYRADGKSDIKFLHYLVSKGSFRRKLEFISPGGAGRNRVMNKKDFLKISESVPTSIEEQKKIGAFFANLDHLITLHQRELDHCKNLKKGLLQQMFV